ncbi:MAG: hypothetical protein HUJ67_07075 [Ruminiclostridium sp.]|nr:hypothetical protein [Ruminiclostridium sp.]
MKRLYGDIKMTWAKVVLFAVVAGVYTGLVMLVPFLKGTSFQDIGISYEWWVIFAVIVVVNCEKSWEAMLKCFIFFLISQPLVYTVEILAGTLSFDMAWGYYVHTWLPQTLLTLPGGFIAYFCKKQNVLGGVILGIGNSIQALMALWYFKEASIHFPFHLLSGLVAAGSIILMSVMIQKEKKNRLVAILTPVVLVAAILVLAKVTGRII